MVIFTELVTFHPFYYQSRINWYFYKNIQNNLILKVEANVSEVRIKVKSKVVKWSLYNDTDSSN